MDRSEFARRLIRASERCLAVARRYVLDDLPSEFRHWLPRWDDPSGRRGPQGTLKYFGGRFVRPEELQIVAGTRAVDLLWTNDRVPAWINMSVASIDAATTQIEMQCSKDLAKPDDRLPHDLDYDPADPIEPFRVRGPLLPAGWISLEASGRFHLQPRSSAG